MEKVDRSPIGGAMICGVCDLAGKKLAYKDASRVAELARGDPFLNKVKLNPKVVKSEPVHQGGCFLVQGQIVPSE